MRCSSSKDLTFREQGRRFANDQSAPRHLVDQAIELIADLRQLEPVHLHLARVSIDWICIVQAIPPITATPARRSWCPTTGSEVRGRKSTRRLARRSWPARAARFAPISSSHE